jgi:hypothetical protein
LDTFVAIVAFVAYACVTNAALTIWPPVAALSGVFVALSLWPIWRIIQFVRRRQKNTSGENAFQPTPEDIAPGFSKNIDEARIWDW